MQEQEQGAGPSAPPEQQAPPRVIFQTPKPCGCVEMKFADDHVEIKKCLVCAIRYTAESLNMAALGLQALGDRVYEALARAKQQKAMQQVRSAIAEHQQQ